MAVGRSAARGGRGGLKARVRPASRGSGAGASSRDAAVERPARASEGSAAPQAAARRFKQMSAVAAAAVAVAFLSVGFGLWQAAAGQAAVDGATRGAVPVPVTVRDVSAGELLGSDAVTLKEVPAQYRQESTLEASFIDDVAAGGARALVDIPANTQLSAGLVAGGAAAGKLSAQLSQGMEAVSLSVDDETGVAGQIKPYDTVRVVCVREASGGQVSLDVVCESARVLSVGGDGAGEGVAYSAVTIEVDPDQADEVRIAQASSALSLQLVCAGELAGR